MKTILITAAIHWADLGMNEPENQNSLYIFLIEKIGMVLGF